MLFGLSLALVGCGTTKQNQATEQLLMAAAQVGAHSGQRRFHVHVARPRGQHAHAAQPVARRQPSDSQGTNFLQIWLLPNQRGVKPGYEQKHFAPEEKRGQLKLLVSADGRDDSISAHADVLLYGGLLDADQTVEHIIAAQRLIYIHVAKGSLAVNNQRLEAGDGMTITEEKAVTISGTHEAEVLLFDLPKKV